MRKVAAFLITVFLLLQGTVRTHAFQDNSPKFDGNINAGKLKAIIDGYLGRPYVWGASGLKSFDCSGFVWRVFYENGILIKRTTARKLYVSLPKVSEEDSWKFGNVVFFDNLKHCGIVCDRGSFYHAESRIGINRSQFKPYWRPKVVGVRQFPLKQVTGENGSASP